MMSEGRQSELGSGLTTKQRLFVEHYLGAANYNGVQAARMAGYQGNDHTLSSVAYENLRKPEIAAFIANLLETVAMSRNEVLARLTEQGRASMADFLDVQPGGVTMLDMNKAKEAKKLGIVKKYKFSRKSGMEIELYDAQAAIVHMGRYHKLFTERIDLKFADKSDDDLLAETGAELAAFLASQVGSGETERA